MFALLPASSLATGCLLLASLAFSAGPASALGQKAYADLKGRDGRDLGRAEIIETAAGVLVRIKAKGLSAGAHGMHVRETGKCQGDFSSAGGIYNPLGAKHGFLHSEGPMVGDLPNLIVAANGEVEVELLSPFLTLSKDSEDTIFDADGSALVISEAADDYRTQPDGKSGAGIACGVIVPAK